MTTIPHDPLKLNAIKLHPEAVSLFIEMLRCPRGSFFFYPNVDPDGDVIDRSVYKSHNISGVTTLQEQYRSSNELLHKNYCLIENNYKRKDYIQPYSEVVYAEEPQLVKTLDQFHYAFLSPQFTEHGQPLLSEDRLRQWESARLAGKDYVLPLHIMLVDQMFNAVLPGGYFGAVLPKRWVGSAMRFVKWWSENVALVAKVQLPSNAAQYHTYIASQEDIENNPDKLPRNIYDLPEYCTGIHHKKDFVSTGNLYLFIWHKPIDPEKVSRQSAMFFATRRWTAFAGKLKSFDDDDFQKLVQAFCKSDWYRYSIRPWLSFIKEDTRSYRTDDTWPRTLKSPKELRIVESDAESKPDYLIRRTINEIKSDELAVHIKFGSTVKLETYSPAAAAILHEIELKSGEVPKNELGSKKKKRHGEEEDEERNPKYPVYRFFQRLKGFAFSENRDWLLKTLTDNGLHPYVLASDHICITKDARWLDIQLSPIERTVKVPTDEDGIDEWETLYDDMSVQAAYPEIFNLWMKRARQMKLDKYQFTYDFQFIDIVTMACKQCILNGSVMGLGKTRENLFLALLLGIEKSLQILPTKLIGVWQEEIETTIANYVRRVKTNWMGKEMSADYNLIQWARDLKPDRIKTFNIISYENLPRVPKDSLFFKCPVCSFIVCSPKLNQEQPCPQCNHGREQERLRQNKIMELKKYKAKHGIVIDDRVSSRNLVMMLPVTKVQRKLTRKTKYRTERTRDKITGIYKTEEIAIHEDVERKPHLKWTFAHLLRNRFPLVQIDEANYIKSAEAQRSFAISTVNGRRRVANTGTPVRGFPKSVCNILNWTFAREVYPDYRGPNNNEAGIARFQKKYAYFIERKGSTPKLIPRINNPELFQSEIAPLMLRRLRNEPAVAEHIPPINPELNMITVPMNDEHEAYYRLWLKEFVEWWRLKRIEEDKKDAKASNDLMVKLGYLMRVSSIPHFVFDSFLKSNDVTSKSWAQKIGIYDGPITSKFECCTKMIKKIQAHHEKTIVFASNVANLELGKQWCLSQDPRIPCLTISGNVSTAIKSKDVGSRSPRQQIVDSFRYKDYMVLWASIKCMAEGYNIPEANHGIFMDYTWNPADWEQAIARMLRPQQKRSVYGTFLVHEGTVDEYVAMWVQLKAKSASEGVDYEEFSDFTAKMVPDFKMYADAIVSGEDRELLSRMRDALEEFKKLWSGDE